MELTLVFASLRYRRYDAPAVCLAGVACSVFWYPIVWFTHGIYLYPVSFILSDLALRVLGGAVGDGLLAGGVALLVLRLVGRRWDSPSAPAFRPGGWNLKDANAVGLLVISLGVLLIVLTHGFPSVSNFFLSIGPNIRPGVPTEEEYNPGYVMGVLLIFLVLAVLAFYNLRSLYSDEEASSAEGLRSSNG